MILGARVAQIGVRTEELWNFVYLEKKKKRKKNPNFWKLRNKIVFLDSGRTQNIDGLLTSRATCWCQRSAPMVPYVALTCRRALEEAKLRRLAWLRRARFKMNLGRRIDGIGIDMGRYWLWK